MALIVEDGTGDDPTANSYATLVDLKAYNTDRGRVTYGTDPELEAAAILAVDYIQSLESNMLGFRTYGQTQPLAFPRTDIIIENEYIDADIIPTAIIYAQAELMYQIRQGVIPMQTITTANVKRKKIGPLETEWFAGGVPSQPTMPAVMAWLGPFMIGGSIQHMRVVRV